MGKKLGDVDLALAGKALKRAAKSARIIGRQTKTSCFVLEDGEIVDLMRRPR